MLTARGGTVLGYGDEEQIREDIETYKHNGIIHSGLKNTPVYVNVTLRECPSGFCLDCESTRCKCTCSQYICDDKNRNKGEISKGKGVFHLIDNSWVRVDGSGV